MKEKKNRKNTENWNGKRTSRRTLAGIDAGELNVFKPIAEEQVVWGVDLVVALHVELVSFWIYFWYKWLPGPGFDPKLKYCDPWFWSSFDPNPKLLWSNFDQNYVFCVLTNPNPKLFWSNFDRNYVHIGRSPADGRSRRAESFVPRQRFFQEAGVGWESSRVDWSQT